MHEARNLNRRRYSTSQVDHAFLLFTFRPYLILVIDAEVPDFRENTFDYDVLEASTIIE